MGDVRYCTTEDGVRIAYSVEGDGPALLLSHNPYAFSLSHLVPALDKSIHRIGRGRQLIRFDLRGTGLSQHAVDDVSPAALVRDVEAVVTALKLERFVLFGVAFGGPRAIEYAAHHSDLVEGLVLYDTFPRFTDAFPLQVSQALPLLCRGNWKLATRTFADAGVRRQDELEGLRWAQMIEESLTGEMMARLIESHTSLDVTDLLPRVECPTLVCHSRTDGMYPFAFGQEMAATIPNARLVPLDGDPAGPFSNTDLAVRALETVMQAVAASFPSLAPSSERSVSCERGALTPREVDVLSLIAAGRTSRQIADELNLSVRTIGRHITNLYNKIGAASRADATAYAVRHGISKQ